MEEAGILGIARTCAKALGQEQAGHYTNTRRPGAEGVDGLSPERGKTLEGLKPHMVGPQHDG